MIVAAFFCLVFLAFLVTVSLRFASEVHAHELAKPPAQPLLSLGAIAAQRRILTAQRADFLNTSQAHWENYQARDEARARIIEIDAQLLKLAEMEGAYDRLPSFVEEGGFRLSAEARAEYGRLSEDAREQVYMAVRGSITDLDSAAQILRNAGFTHLANDLYRMTRES